MNKWGNYPLNKTLAIRRKKKWNKYIGQYLVYTHRGVQFMERRSLIITAIDREGAVFTTGLRLLGVL